VLELSHSGEPLQVILSQRGIHDVKGLFAPLEALFYERAKHPVLFVEAVEKTTNVTLIAQVRHQLRESDIHCLQLCAAAPGMIAI
jgi:hypothetical protein